MKRITSALLALGVLTGVSTTAFAADADVPADTYAAMGFYLRGDAGWSWLNYSGPDDSAFAVGGGVGYQYNEYLRADLRADWAGNFNKGASDTSVSTVTGNMYLDIPTGSMITPYLGAGLGYGWAIDDVGPDKEGFAFALMAGASVDLSESLSADVGYRYREIMDNGQNPREHQVLVGLRYKF